MDHFPSHIFTMSERLLTFSSFLTYCLLIWQTRFIVIKSKSISNSVYCFKENVDDCNETGSILLTRGESKRFWRLKATTFDKNLTFIVVPCSSEISWSIQRYTLKPQDYAAKSENMGGYGQAIYEEISDSMSYYTVTRHAFYVLTLSALKEDTYVFIRAVEEDLPPFLKYNKTHSISIEHKRKGMLTFHWSPSVLDPKWTTYCVVINTQGPYHSLCAAREDRDDFPTWSRAFSDKLNAESPKNYFKIRCAHGKTKLTLKNFTENSRYYVDVFARSNFTYNLPIHYASKTFIHQEPSRFISLRDGKVATANLNKLRGKAVFKFKTSKNAVGSLEFVIIPCGGTVEVELFLAGIHRKKAGVVIERVQIRNVYRFTVSKIQPQQRYNLKVSNFQHFDSIQHSSNVEVIATTNRTLSSTVPTLPDSPVIYEFKGLRTCRSVTVGWMPIAKTRRPVWYCVYAFEKELSSDFNPIPDQCKLEARVKYLNSLASMQCHQNSTENRTSVASSVITQEINRLKPNSVYIVQVVVKIQGGRSLSYDRLTVQTKRYCKDLQL